MPRPRSALPARLALLLALAAPVAARAQAADVRGAEAVAREFFTALVDGRWRDVPPLVHPTALREFRAERVSTARSMLRSFDAPAPADTTDAAAMAAWRDVRQMREEMGPPIAREFAGVATLPELTALSTEEMVARWFEAQTTEYQSRLLLSRERGRLEARFRDRGDSAAVESLRRTLDSVLAAPASPEMSARPQRVVLGTVLEGDSTAHVAFRTPDPYVPPSSRPHGQPDLLTLRRTAGGWRLWQGWTDRDGMHIFGAVIIGGDSSEVAMLREMAAREVAWPGVDSATGAPTGPAWPRGRAHLVGEVNDSTPPRALVIEVREREGAAPVRVEVPVSAFGDLTMLLGPWPSFVERAAALRRTPPPGAR